MDVVLVGLPGSGKSAVGRRLAARRGAEFVDLDQVIERAAGRSVAQIFEAETEAGFRRREREAIERLGAPQQDARVRRVIATGGGAVIDPRNRWHLYRGRRPFWLDGTPERLATRVRAGAGRPLFQGRDPLGRLRELRAERIRFYAPAPSVDADGAAFQVLERLERLLTAQPRPGVRLLDADTAVGRLELGEGQMSDSLLAELTALAVTRVVVASDAGSWRTHGRELAERLGESGFSVESARLPKGEAAKTFESIEQLVRHLARMRLERRDPIVALGGGAVGDAAGFAAAIYLRGVPLVQIPTTLLAQIDAAIGGKTAIDIPEGKNLVGAFYQPRAIIVDVATLATLPARQRRAALGEAVKYAVLGDERLFELLEQDGRALAAGEESAVESGALAELVERCAWRKVEIVTADEREEGERIVLNLGHSLGHAIEASGGFSSVLHGEAVAYGLRGAIAIGRALGITPEDRANRIERLLDSLGFTKPPSDVRAASVRTHLRADKKHARGALRWVLPDRAGVRVQAGVDERVVELGLAAALGPPAALDGRKTTREPRRTRPATRRAASR
jgi:shikimate kinase/3-dehydroquinate synthase